MGGVFALFHSPSCGTCQALYAPFAALARRYERSQIRFVKCDAWMNDLPEWLGVSGVPDLRFFPAIEGEEDVTKNIEFTGNDRSEETMARWLDEKLSSSKIHDEL